MQHNGISRIKITKMLERNFIQPRPVHILTTSSSKMRFNIIPNIDKTRSAVVHSVKAKMMGTPVR
jgi:hypothetical protein